MIEKVVRMNGNPKYEYAKAYIVLVDDKIYVSGYAQDEANVNTLYELNNNYIKYCKKHNKLEECIKLLDLIRPRHQGFDSNYNELCNVNYDVKQAMRVCDITNEDQNNVGDIEGLTITNW